MLSCIFPGIIFLTSEGSEVVVLIFFILCIALWSPDADLFLFHLVWCHVLVFVLSYLTVITSLEKKGAVCLAEVGSD